MFTQKEKPNSFLWLFRAGLTFFLGQYNRERERVDLFNWISRIDVPTVLRSQRANEVGYLVEAELKSNQN